jgi:presenilin-like A22 family membrane protease
MIQRIQSIWLLLASIFALLTLKFSFFAYAVPKPLNQIVGETSLAKFTAFGSNLILIISVAVSAASFVVIFLYKDRKRQLLVTSVIAVVAIINIILYFIQMKTFKEGQYNISITSAITFLIPVFLLLAARGIWKDEQLVKSADRLR